MTDDKFPKTGFVWKTDALGRTHLAFYGRSIHGELGIFYLGVRPADIVKTHETEHGNLQSMTLASLEAWISSDPCMAETGAGKER